MATVRRKMRQKCTPFAQKCTPNPCGGIRNANRSSKNALKMQTVRSKIVPREAWLRARRNICGAQIATVRTKMRQKCAPFGRNSMSNMQKWQPFVRKCVKKCAPSSRNRVLRLNGKQRARALRFTRVSESVDPLVPGQPLEFWGAKSGNDR